MEQNDPLSPSAEVLHALQHVGREASEKQQEKERETRALLSHRHTSTVKRTRAFARHVGGAGWVGGGRGIFVSNYNPRVRERGDRLKLEHIV